MEEKSVCTENKNDSKVILVSCSGMCVHGHISREAVYNVIYEKSKGKCDWVCPTAIPAGIKWQVNRLKNAQAIIAVPGCPAHCDIKILKEAGFKATAVIDANDICGFTSEGMELSDIPSTEKQEFINRLSAVIENEVNNYYHD